MSLLLPPRELVTKPDADDPIDYYYRPLTRWLYRARLRDALILLGEGPYDALLDIGYGSGVFLPELARRTKGLVGVDVHAGRAGVAAMAEQLGIDVELHDASLFELPFEDGTFDALVSRERDGAPARARRGAVGAPPGDETRRGARVRHARPERRDEHLLPDRRLRPFGDPPVEPSRPRGGDRPSAGARLDRRIHFPRVLPLGLSAYVNFRCSAR